MGPRTALLVLATLMPLGAPGCDDPRSAGDHAVRFEGRLRGDRDLSAVERLGDRLALVSSETSEIVLLDRADRDRWIVARRPLYEDRGNKELDIEALAADGSYLYAASSHALVRRQPKADASVEKNRRRIGTIRRHPIRDRVLRLTLGDDGRVEATESINLRSFLERDPLLGRFTGIPGKENGVEIEGLAARDGELWLGLRGPVLRSGLVPVLRLRWDEPDRIDLRLVDLGGRGVAALSSVDPGLLVLAAAGRGELPPAEIYWWDGGDGTPGRDGPVGRLVALAGVPAVDGGRAEGMTVLSTDRRGWELLIVYDGVDGGAPLRLRVDRPPDAVGRR